MEATKLLGGDPALPFEATVTSGDGSLYYAFSAPDGSSLTVYRDRYATAAERFGFMASQDGSTGDTDSLTVSYTDEDGTPREERYIDCPEGEGGHWEICVTGSGHLEELRQMASSFRVTPGTEPVIESDVTLRRLFADAELDDMTITRIERGAVWPAASAAGSCHGVEYLDILRSLHWADDLAPYEGEDPGWCVILETPDFRIAMNDVGWAGVTTAQGSFAAWIVDYEELYHGSGFFGWDRLTEWYDEAVAAENLTGEPAQTSELSVYESAALNAALLYPAWWNGTVTLSDGQIRDGFFPGFSEGVPCVRIDLREDVFGVPPYDAFDQNVVYENGVGYVYWLPAGMSGPEAESGESVTLYFAGDGSELRCWLPMNSKLNWLGAGSEGERIFNAYDTIEWDIRGGSLIARPADQAEGESYGSNQAGSVSFYAAPIDEAPYVNRLKPVRYRAQLTAEQADRINRILNSVELWHDDNIVDRITFYFDGEFQLANSDFVVYFSDENNVLYYDCYFAEISEEDIRYIMGIGQPD